MRLEDQSMVQLINKGELGEFQFFRYFLSIRTASSDQMQVAIYEAFELFKKLNQGEELDYIYTSVDKNEKVFLITGKSSKNVLANLFFDFSNEKSEPIKQVELVGSKGLYQFDTNAETAYYSNFSDKKFPIEFGSRTERTGALYKKIKESASLNKKVNLKGER